MSYMNLGPAPLGYYPNRAQNSTQSGIQPMGVMPIDNGHPRPDPGMQPMGVMPIDNGHPRPDPGMQPMGVMPIDNGHPRPDPGMQPMGVMPIDNGHPRPRPTPQPIHYLNYRPIPHNQRQFLQMMIKLMFMFAMMQQTQQNGYGQYGQN